MKNAELFAPKEFWAAPPHARDEVTNGCGTKGLGGILVPDTMYGLSITAACNIHDWMYAYGECAEGKEKADRIFLNNMNRIINTHTTFWPLKALRRQRAKKYYLSVKYFGGDAYWEGKNKPDEVAEVAIEWDITDDTF